jgi:hypothetical protein
MIKHSIVTIALFTALHAQADYLFVNITGHFREGYPVDVKDPKGNLLTTVQNGKSKSVREYPSYQLQAHKDGGQRKGQPLNFTPEKDSNDVIVINVRNLMNKLEVHQMTLEEAKAHYGKRVQFPK